MDSSLKDIQKLHFLGLAWLNAFEDFKQNNYTILIFLCQDVKKLKLFQKAYIFITYFLHIICTVELDGIY